MVGIVEGFQLQVQLHFLVGVRMQISIKITGNCLAHSIIIMQMLLVMIVLNMVRIIQYSAAVLNHQAR